MLALRWRINRTDRMFSPHPRRIEVLDGGDPPRGGRCLETRALIDQRYIPAKILKKLVHVGCLANSKAVRVRAYFSPRGCLLHKQWPGGGIISPREIEYKAQYKGRPTSQVCDMVLRLLKAQLSHLLEDGEV
jgi:hypothetical protein